MELPSRDYSDMSNDTYKTPIQSINYHDIKMTRLMELIGTAIESWAVEYHLENLPKKIVFEQAYDAMRAIEQIINGKE